MEVLGILFGIFLLAQSSFAEDNDKQQDGIYEEAVKVLQEYLKIDTTNPPGNEMNTAKFLKAVLEREGIQGQIFDLGDNRANFYAVLKGDGTKRPILLSHHMDVVSADAAYWKLPPFAGRIAAGEIYGRGAIDMKGKGIIDLMTMINLKRSNAPLKRDIILLAVADEEVNSLGTQWLIQNKPELIGTAEFLIDEGSNIRVGKDGQVHAYFFSIGDKMPLWLTIIFTGEPGHGSMPIADSAVNRAINAAHKILNQESEFVVLADAKAEIEHRLFGQDARKIPGFEGDLDTLLQNERFRKELAKIPEINALIKNTIAITCLKGSDKINTIPNQAAISLDCRLLPGTDHLQFIEHLKKVIGDDTAIFNIEEFMPTCQSPTNTSFVKALEICAHRRHPQAKIIPVLLTSSTDSSYYRRLGIHAYGFEPYAITDSEANLSHANDERISVENIRFGIDLLTEMLLEMNG